LDQEADIDIPRRVQGAWKPTGGVRVLHRALTSAERAAVTMRAQDLEEALRPYAPDEREDVEIALFAMLGGFRSMRQQADNAEAVIQVLRNVLREFPAWAIEQGCLIIAQGRGVDADGKPLDRTWPPNDPQVHAVVTEVVRIHCKNLQQARDLLNAPVEQIETPRPSREELEAKLGRPLNDSRRLSPPAPIKDGHDSKHMQRVLADIEARRLRRELAAQASTIGESSA
jgi:hypothetical protein